MQSFARIRPSPRLTLSTLVHISLSLSSSSHSRCATHSTVYCVHRGIICLIQLVACDHSRGATCTSPSLAPQASLSVEGGVSSVSLCRVLVGSHVDRARTTAPVPYRLRLHLLILRLRKSGKRSNARSPMRAVLGRSAEGGIKRPQSRPFHHKGSWTRCSILSGLI
jgi:hypothetical protein